MAKIEIDETELNTYKQVFSAVRQGLANPKTRSKLLEVQAELTPESAAPEVTINKELAAFKAELLGEFTKFREDNEKSSKEREEKAEREKLEARWLRGQQAARDQGYTKDGLEALEKFMEDEGIANHVHAIPAFEKLNPPPKPVETGGQRWDFFGAKETRPPDLNALLEGNEDVFLAQAIPDALNSARKI